MGESPLGQDTDGDVSRAFYDQCVAGSECCVETSINHIMVRVRLMMYGFVRIMILRLC